MWEKKSESEVTQSCLTLSNSMDCSLPRSSNHGIFQARILGFSSSHVWMWELAHKESWAQKNWCFWTVVLEKTLESPLDCKEIQPVNPKGDQSWISIGRTDAEAETPILWPPDSKNWLIGKDPDAGKDWRREEKGMKRMRWLDGSTYSMDMDSRNWWWTGRPGMLQSIGSQRVRHDWVTELNWTDEGGSPVMGLVSL